MLTPARIAEAVWEVTEARKMVQWGNDPDHVLGALDRALELLGEGGGADGQPLGDVRVRELQVAAVDVAPPRSESSSLPPTGADLPALVLESYGAGLAWLRKASA